ncbi:MAG: iron-sulfur cluster insertion protein ErpA [Chloroflexi bacterium]|nr:iron-sulfur cluster insertion protein ErpA [Chloroflexota bacterium]
MEAAGTLVTLTDDAVAQLKSLLAKENNSELALRVFVSPGGCSGLNYGMALDDVIQDDDLVSEYDGVKVVVDEMSGYYLKGAQVDYVNNLMGGGFAVHNPNAVATCSCGHSFDAGEGGSPKPCH